MHRIKYLLAVSLALGFVATPAFSTPDTKKAPAKTPAPKTPAKKDVKPPPVKKVVMVSAEKKKVLAELYGGFKFGMTKDSVIKELSKQIDNEYDTKIKGTESITSKDRLRKDKNTELKRIKDSYVDFNGTNVGGWDVSIIENEFAHKTSEAMIDRWENKDGKNQRRFFFFFQGQLWKMALSIDVSVLPEDKRNFETFSAVMTGKYGPGAIEGSEITWTSDEFEVRAIDKLKSYTALILAIEQPATKKTVLALRTEKADKKPETSAVIKSVLDTDKTDKPDVKQNSNAVDAVINAQKGGGTPAPPKKK